MTQEQKQREIEAILDELSDDELVDVNNTYQECVNGDKYIYSTDDFDELMTEKSPSEIANMVALGDYNPYHMWFWFNGYGNVESSDYPDADGWFACEIAEYAVENDEDFGRNDIRAILDDEEEEAEE